MSEEVAVNIAVPMRPHGATICDSEVARIAQAIQSDGYARVDNFFTPDEIDEARVQALAAVESANGVFIRMRDTAGFHGHILSGGFVSADLLSLCERVCRYQGYRLSSEPAYKQVLRCLFGRQGLEHAYYFHYDSYLLTILVPIAIPIEGKTGDLLMFPNRRKTRKSYFFNMLEKVIFELPPTQKILKMIAMRTGKAVRLKMEPGSIYLFNGDRSLHANEECDVDKLRSTLLFHYAETYQDHWMYRLRQRIVGK
jgi:hypothetical protein